MARSPQPDSRRNPNDPTRAATKSAEKSVTTLAASTNPRPRFKRHIRQHWSIENSCHWVLDTAFRGDHKQTYIGYAAKNLGALRRIVLNLLKIDLTDTRCLPKKRRCAMLALNYRNSLLSLA